MAWLRDSKTISVIGYGKKILLILKVSEDREVDYG